MNTNNNNTQQGQIFSDIRLTVVKQDKLRAIGNVTVGGAVTINGIRVIEGSKGLFVAVPQKKKEDGSYEDIVHPVSKEVAEQLRVYVMAAYQKALEAKEGAAK